MAATAGRSRKRPPLRFDWSRVILFLDEGDGWGSKVTFYRARPDERTLLNAQRRGGSWTWGIIWWPDPSDVPILDGGTVGTLTEAKHRAELACPPYLRPRQTELWGADNNGESAESDLPF